jgi:hypothetical protein
MLVSGRELGVAVQLCSVVKSFPLVGAANPVPLPLTLVTAPYGVLPDKISPPGPVSRKH